jgi:hypothetical protein
MWGSQRLLTSIIHGLVALGASMDEIKAGQKRMEHKMAAIDDELAAVQTAQANSDALITKVGADVTTLLGLIGQVPTAGLTAAQQTALDDIASHAGKINDALTAVDASAQPPAATPPAAS